MLFRVLRVRRADRPRWYAGARAFPWIAARRRTSRYRYSRSQRLRSRPPDPPHRGGPSSRSAYRRNRPDRFPGNLGGDVRRGLRLLCSHTVDLVALLEHVRLLLDRRLASWDEPCRNFVSGGLSHGRKQGLVLYLYMSVLHRAHSVTCEATTLSIRNVTVMQTGMTAGDPMIGRPDGVAAGCS